MPQPSATESLQLAMTNLDSLSTAQVLETFDSADLEKLRDCIDNIIEHRCSSDGRLYEEIPFNAIMTRTASGSDWHTMAFDHVIIWSNICATLLFGVGSCCFFTWAPEPSFAIGAIIFVIGSAMMTIAAAAVAVRFWRRFAKHVFLEAICIMTGSALYAIGSVLLLPSLASEATDDIVAGLFVAGSCGLVIAAFFRGTGLAEQWGLREQRTGRVKVCYRLASLAMVSNLFGSVLFLTGSVELQPNFNIGCKRPEGLHPGLHPVQSCADIADNAVINFVIACALFLMDLSINTLLLTSFGTPRDEPLLSDESS